MASFNRKRRETRHVSGRHESGAPKPGRWSGRATRFALDPCEDTPFDQRLTLRSDARGRWIALTYRGPPAPRPMIRLVRSSSATQDFVLPGVALGAASWLGWIPADTEEIRLAADPGFAIERVGLRSRASLLAECARKRPSRVVPAIYAMLRADERRYRDILRGACAVTPIGDYAGWRASRLRTVDEGPAVPVRIGVVVRDGDGLAATIAGLRAQTHPLWRLMIVSRSAAEDGGTTDDDPRIATVWHDGDGLPTGAVLLGESDALCLLDPGDVLWPDALATLAARLAGEDNPDLVYADGETGSAPRLKPDWSPDLALVTLYPGKPTLLSRRLLERLDEASFGSVEHLTVAAYAATRNAAHVPRILCTARHIAPGATHAEHLDAALRRSGSPARPRKVGAVLDLSWPIPDPPPLASIIIPSRDRPELIGQVTRDILTRTDYPAIELVVVDNGSTDPAVLDLYGRLRADPRVRIEPFPHPFDFAAMMNAGAATARGNVLVFLNNDIAVIEPGWLAALVGQAARPEVGAVGAKLLYADGTLQHAGVVVGLGGRSGHILRRHPGDTPGRIGGLRVAHEVSAVTAACLAVERRKFEAVGGFDGAAFPIDFNDADLCLRLAAAGWKTIWTPRATLYHLESISRGPAIGEARRRYEREADAFAARWRDAIRHDPYHHPALTLTGFREALE